MPDPLTSLILGKMLSFPADNQEVQAQTWDKRPDGAQKGNGFLGVLRRPDGGVMSEYSIPLWEKGKWKTPSFQAGPDVPSIVPTTTAPELNLLINSKEPGEENPELWNQLTQRAINFAKQRQAAGKPFFADPAEEQDWVMPQFPRAAVKQLNGDISLPNQSGAQDPRLKR